MLNFIKNHLLELLQEKGIYQFVDFICIKVDCNNSMIKAYCFEGHPFYERYVSDDFKLLTQTIHNTGCYGISEIPFDLSFEQLKSNKIEIRLNISNDKQYEKVQEIILSNCKITDEISIVLRFLGDMYLQKDRINDYRSLYFCGITKNEKNEEIQGISLYYKTFSISQGVEKGKGCIEYLKQINRIADDSAFNFVNFMISDDLATLESVGVDILKNGMYKLKYYLRIQNAATLHDRIIPYYMNVHSLDNGLFREYLDYISSLEDFEFDCIQVSSGFEMKKYSINLYFSPKSDLKTRSYYCVRTGLVLRNIGGVFFIVDTKDKHCYDVKKLYRLNEIGKIIFEFASQHGVVTIDGIVSYLKTILKDYTPDMYNTIFNDTLDFICKLTELGYMKEVN